MTLRRDVRERRMLSAAVQTDADVSSGGIYKASSILFGKCID